VRYCSLFLLFLFFFLLTHVWFEVEFEMAVLGLIGILVLLEDELTAALFLKPPRSVLLLA